MAMPLLLAQMLLDVIDGLLYRRDMFGCIVRGLALELLFERHDQLYGVEGIGSEVIDEGGFAGHLLFLDPQLLNNDLLDAFFYAAHEFLSSNDGPGKSVSGRIVGEALRSCHLQKRPAVCHCVNKLANNQTMCRPPWTCSVSPVT